VLHVTLLRHTVLDKRGRQHYPEASFPRPQWPRCLADTLSLQGCRLPQPLLITSNASVFNLLYMYLLFFVPAITGKAGSTSLKLPSLDPTGRCGLTHTRILSPCLQLSPHAACRFQTCGICFVCCRQGWQHYPEAAFLAPHWPDGLAHTQGSRCRLAWPLFTLINTCNVSVSNVL
jgi:hypothetical protein